MKVKNSDLFSDSKTAFVIVALLKLAHEHNFQAYLFELFSLVNSHKSPLYKAAVFTFLSEPKLTHILPMDSDALRVNLDKTLLAKKTQEIDKKISTEITLASLVGPQPKRHPFFFDNQAPQYFDFPELFLDVAKAYNSLSETTNDSSDPDLLLPLPSVVEPSIDDLMTPFPFILESPLFNPDLPQSHTASLILKNMKKATDYDIDVA